MERILVITFLKKVFWIRTPVWDKVICLHLSVTLSTGGVPGGDPPTHPRRLLLRAVRILLECILVKNFFFTGHVFFVGLKRAALFVLCRVICDVRSLRFTSGATPVSYLWVLSRPRWDQRTIVPEHHRVKSPRTPHRIPLHQACLGAAKYWNISKCNA